jgi:septal ring factor EnvC (AmiA/AmiB activator)
MKVFAGFAPVVLLVSGIFPSPASSVTGGQAVSNEIAGIRSQIRAEQDRMEQLRQRRDGIRDQIQTLRVQKRRADIRTQIDSLDAEIRRIRGGNDADGEAKIADLNAKISDLRQQDVFLGDMLGFLQQLARARQDKQYDRMKVIIAQMNTARNAVRAAHQQAKPKPGPAKPVKPVPGSKPNPPPRTAPAPDPAIDSLTSQMKSVTDQINQVQDRIIELHARERSRQAGR